VLGANRARARKRVDGAVVKVYRNTSTNPALLPGLPFLHLHTQSTQISFLRSFPHFAMSPLPFQSPPLFGAGGPLKRRETASRTPTSQSSQIGAHLVHCHERPPYPSKRCLISA